MNKEEIPSVTIFNVEEWRDWLAKNHLKEKKVALISFKKHTGEKSISHREAMNEAICFGWIDTTIKRLDENRFQRYFVRRGEKANWSINTLKYARELFSAGKMAPQGLLRYAQGLKKKPHDYGLSKKPKMPAELRKALETDKTALNNFENFAPSTKYMFYRWILRAKGDETKKKRCDVVVGRAREKKGDLR